MIIIAAFRTDDADSEGRFIRVCVREDRGQHERKARGYRHFIIGRRNNDSCRSVRVRNVSRESKATLRKTESAGKETGGDYAAAGNAGE